MLKKPVQIVEYVWVDGSNNLWSKTKILQKPVSVVKDIPVWTFDGSSTGQAQGHDSDVFLAPRKIYKDPFRGDSHFMVLCECYDDPELMVPNKFNTRHLLAKTLEQAKSLEPWVGIEQEYVLYDAKLKTPFKWLSHQDLCIGPQGPYYCAVGGDQVFGREIIEDHLMKCIEAGIHYYGCNAEVMASQWEFQIGTVDLLTVADHLFMARYIPARV